VVITIYGARIYEAGIVVMIGGAECTNVVVTGPLSNNRVTCRLPSGTGGKVSVLLTSTGQTVEAGALIQYAAPVIHSLSASACRRDGPLRLWSCPTAAGFLLTIDGVHFGDANRPPTVMLGSDPCEVQSADQHRIVCAVAPGIGPKQVVIVQFDGRVSRSEAILAFAECLPGSFAVGMLCDDRAGGRFSARNGSASCAECLPGTFTGVETGASACHPCAAGEYSPAGSTVCSQCTC
jgi:hypothetical protein